MNECTGIVREEAEEVTRSQHPEGLQCPAAEPGG